MTADRSLLVTSLIALAIWCCRAGAQEIPIGASLPSECPSSCLRWFYGDALQSAAPAERDRAAEKAKQLLSAAQQVGNTYAPLRQRAEVAHYAGLVLKNGSGLVPSVPHAAAIKTLLQGSVDVLEEYSKHAAEAYHAAVLEATYRLAEETLGKEAYDSNGMLRPEALKDPKVLNRMFASSTLASAPPELRTALQNERDNLSLNVQMDTHRIARGAAKSLEEIGKRVAAIDSNVSALQTNALPLLLATQRDTQEISRQVHDDRRLLEALAQTLPPRERLALIDAGILSASYAARRAIENAAIAQDIELGSSQVANLLTSSASALRAAGVDPRTVAGIQHASSMITATGVLSSSLFTGNPMTIATSALNLFGVFGGFSPPDPNAGVLAALESLQNEIREYHKETMAALAAIKTDIADLRADLQSRTAALLEVELDVRALAEDFTAQGFTDNCAFVLQDYQTEHPSSLRALNSFFDGAGHYDRYQRCLGWLAERAAPDPDIGMHHFFLLVTAPTAGAPRQLTDDFALRSALRDRVYQPTRCFSELYGAAQQSTSLLAEPDFGLSPNYSHHRTAGTSCSAVPPMLEPRTVLKFATTARALLPLSTVLMRGAKSGSWVVMPEKLQDCGAACWPTDGRPRATVNGLSKVLRETLEQERLLAGAAAAGPLADILDEQVIPQYAAARWAKDDSLNSTLNSLSSTDDSARAETNKKMAVCATGTPVYDALCLMERNPYASRNALRLFVLSRLQKTGTSTKEYGNALRDPFLDDRLKSILGSVFLRRSNGQWSLELPRVPLGLPTSNSGATGGEASPIQAKTDACWTDTPVDGSVSSGVGFRRARCYVLPTEDELRTVSARGEQVLPVFGRDQIDQLAEELVTLTWTAQDMGMPADSVPASIRQALAFSSAALETALSSEAAARK
jgi:hypothetical protein